MMKRMLFEDERFKIKQQAFHPSAFIIHPSSFILALKLFPSRLRTDNPAALKFLIC